MYNDKLSMNSSSRGSSDSVEQYATCHFLQQFHKVLRKIFFDLGFLIAKNPSYFIMVPLFFTVLGMTGVQRLIYEKDPETLFSPENGEGRYERSVVENFFPINYSSNFDPSRLARISPFGMIFALAKDNENVLRVDVFNEIVILDEAIRNLTIEWQGEIFTYNDVCAKKNGMCLGNQILNLVDFMPEIENGSLLLNYPITLYPLLFPFYLGGADVNETEGVLYGAKAVSLSYWFRDDGWKERKRSLLFEEKFLELLEKPNFQHIKVSKFVSKSLGDEFDKNAMAVFSHAGFAFSLMVAFSVCSVFLFDWVRSKLLIGAFGVLSASFATVSAFGFLMYCDVPFTGVNLAAPFLMLGIGIDDMFVVLSAWHRTKIQEEVPIRLAKTYSEAAVSITITSLTNMLSFFIGTFTPFPAVRIFCLYTGFSILFTYIWFITFFGGCLAIAGRQERNQKHIITCRRVLPKSEAENFGWCYKFWCAGGINPDDPLNPKDNQEHILMAFFRDYIGKALNKPTVKVLVICMYILYMGGAIYGCTTVKEGLEREKLTLDNSYSVDFFNVENKFFRKYPFYRLQIIINEKLTYSDEKTKKSILELHDAVEGLDAVGARVFTQSWIRGFYNYLERHPELKENITDETSFITVLKSVFLRPTSPEHLDVVFNEDETEIVASRFIVQAYNIKDSNGDKDMMLDLRRVASEAPFDVVTYHPLFIFFDQYILVRYTCLQTITLAAVVMIVVSLILIPNPLCSLWVAFSIISIEIGVVGYMSLWAVSLDAISMMNLIMCVGFSVDFSAHISYAFLTANGTTPAERVEECLYNVGLPIFQGGISTIVGVIALAMAPSYVFTTFFKTVFLVIFFGLMHGIFLLPVILSVLGPGSCSKNKVDVAVASYVPKLNQ